MKVVGLGLCLAFVIPAGASAHQVEVNSTRESEPRRSPCLRPLELPRKPTWSWSAAPGMRAQVWQWKDSRAGAGHLRVASVQMHAGRGVIKPVARIPTMTDPATEARARGSVAVLNGDFFDTLPRGDALPQGALIIDREPVFVPVGWSRVVVWNAKDRLRTTHVRLAASLTSSDDSVRVQALNDPLVKGRQLSVMTSAWHRTHVPDGLAAIVVKDDRVAAVHRKAKAVRIPQKGYVVVAATAAVLPRVKMRDALRLTLGVETSDYQEIVHAAGHGGVALKDGQLQPVCSDYERLPRPRSMLAWSKDGRAWFLTASSGLPDSSEGLRRGGMTKTELARIARQLGADTAVVLDGGGSTALYSRRGDGVRRMDMPGDSWVRPIPVLWQMSASPK